MHWNISETTMTSKIKLKEAKENWFKGQ